MLSLIAAFIGGWVFSAGLAHRRARRDTETLLYLSKHPGSYGLDLTRAKVGGRGSIRARLARLEDEGLLTYVEEEQGGPERGFAPRRRYFIKDLGLAALRVETARMRGSDG